MSRWRIPASLCRRLWPATLPAAAVLAVLFSAAPNATSGQTSPAASATPAAPPAGAASSSVAPALDNELSVRLLLPASIRDSVRLPVRKWARADMPDAPGGPVIFIATIYPIYDGQGGSTEWLLTNYLQWDGTRWLPALEGYPGERLTRADDIWLARNLTDITALASPPGQDFRIFTVGYTGDGLVSSTLSRTETLAEIYDLTDTTVWSRLISQRETDTGNPGYVLKHAEEVDWIYQDAGNGGAYDLVATVTDSDEVILTGDSAPAGTVLPAAGVTTNTMTEIYTWTDGLYVLKPQALNAPALPEIPAATSVPSPPPSLPSATPAGPTRRPTASPTPRVPAG